MLKDSGISMRQAFGDALLELGAIHPDLVVLDADVSGSTQTIHFGKTFPDRFFNVGVAETNLVDMAAGMATTGLKPVVSTFALFLALKAAEQIRNTVCYNQLPVILAGGYAGLSDSFDGASHQSITDLAIMRALPQMKVYVPFDPSHIGQILEHILKEGGPAYIRLSRNPVPSISQQEIGFHPDMPVRAAKGAHLTMVACGIPSYMAYEAVAELKKKGFETDLFLVTTLKPFRGEGIRQSLEKSGRLLTIEEHTVIGGLRSAVLENTGGDLSYQAEYIAIDDTYCGTGPYLELLGKYGISKKHIIQKAIKLLQA
jgi:transketolase